MFCVFLTFHNLICDFHQRSPYPGNFWPLYLLWNYLGIEKLILSEQCAFQTKDIEVTDTRVCLQEGGKLRAKGIRSKLRKMTCFVTIKSKGIVTRLLNFGLFPFWFSSVEPFPSSQIYFWAMWKVYLSPSNTDPSIRDSVLDHITGMVFPMRWSLDILHVYCLFLVLHVLSELL